MRDRVDMRRGGCAGGLRKERDQYKRLSTVSLTLCYCLLTRTSRSRRHRPSLIITISTQLDNNGSPSAQKRR
jgi:hypothetical protein